MNRTPPACRWCRHHYLTWDAHFPYGCRAMGFKSRRSPGVEVRRATGGRPCLMFQAKPGKGRSDAASRRQAAGAAGRSGS